MKFYTLCLSSLLIIASSRTRQQIEASNLRLRTLLSDKINSNVQGKLGQGSTIKVQSNIVPISIQSLTPTATIFPVAQNLQTQVAQPVQIQRTIVATSTGPVIKQSVVPISEPIVLSTPTIIQKSNSLPISQAVTPILVTKTPFVTPAPLVSTAISPIETLPQNQIISTTTTPISIVPSIEASVISAPQSGINLVRGQQNAIIGEKNILDGHLNSVDGDLNFASGHSNSISGSGNDVLGSDAVVKGHQNTIISGDTINMAQLF